MVPGLRILRNSGIEIEGDPNNIRQLPPYAKELRDLLLNFEGILPRIQKIPLEDFPEVKSGPRPSQTLYRDWNYTEGHEIWTSAEKLRNRAKRLDARYKEDKWKGVMTNFVFEGISDQASDQVIHMRDRLHMGSADELFSNAISIRGNLSDNNKHQPKPDIWFGLSLYIDTQLSQLKGLELADKGIQYFTKDGLKNVFDQTNKNFFYGPMKEEKSNGGFPWMVVELKKENGDEGECLRQAANASHTCLVLCKRLAAKAARDPLPVVAFTSIGPKAKLFLTYKSEDEEELYLMSCIWSGDVQHILHAVELRRIINQLKFWALRIFKPWVTECLEYWFEPQVEMREPMHSNARKGFAHEMLINKIRQDKVTQTMRDDEESSTICTRCQFSELRLGKTDPSRSNSTEPDPSFSEPTLAADRHRPVASESSESLPEARSQAAGSDVTYEPSLSGSSSADSEADQKSIKSPRDRSLASSSDSEIPHQDQSQASSDQTFHSCSAGSSPVNDKPRRISEEPIEAGNEQSTIDLEARLRDIHTRAREAQIRSLLLTNRFHSLSQRITLGQLIVKNALNSRPTLVPRAPSRKAV